MLSCLGEYRFPGFAVSTRAVHRDATSSRGVG